MSKLVRIAVIVVATFAYAHAGEPLANPKSLGRKVRSAEIDAATLRDLLRKTIYCVSTDPARPNLSAVHLEFDGAAMKMIATDGHRLAIVERPFAMSATDGISVTHKDALALQQALQHASGHVTLSLASGHLVVRVGEQTLDFAVSTEGFPNYSAVVPRNHVSEVVLPRSSLITTLSRISDSSVNIALAKNHVKLSGPSGDADLTVRYAGQPAQITLNAGYIGQALREMDGETVTLELNGTLEPAVFRAEKERNLAVVMPMRDAPAKQ